MKNCFAILFFSASLLVCSCASVDVEQSIRDSSAGKLESIEDLPPSFRIEPEIKIVERPIFVPEKEAARPPLSGYDAALESNRTGILKPSDYSHAAMVYDYDIDWVYEVYAQILRACDIILEPGEQVIESPFISDSVRWMLGAGISYERGLPVQHIYVKPSESDISASLIINTDRRVYHLILRSYKNVYMPIVKWRYPSSAMPDNYISTFKSEDGEPETRSSYADPRFLSFNYRITYSWLRKPHWLPELAFDDGSKTYVTFPESVLNRELPAVFENRRDVLNYRVLDNLIVIDKLIENITIKIERTEVTITKKRSTNGR